MRPRDPRFPPVAYDANRVPYNAPQFVPPSAAAQSLPLAQKGQMVAGVAASAGITGVRNDHAYANVIELNVTVGTTSIQVLDSPTGLRNLLMFRNASAADTIYVGFGKPATTASILAITAGQIVLFDTVVPQDDIWAISSGASSSFSVAYSTIPEYS